MADVDQAVAEAFRRETPVVLATIARLTGDLQLAEDAVQDAQVVALARWPADGVPTRPGAWITTVARNQAIDRLRREARRPELERAASLDALAAAPAASGPAGDDDLLLLFTACHPALAPDTRVALALRFACGLRTSEVARLLLKQEDAVAKALQRAKGKIRDAVIPLRVPPPELLPERLPAVLETIYLLFTEGYAPTAGADLVRGSLCDEAIRLTRALDRRWPGDPGAEALLALLLLQDSRREARVDGQGDLVLLADQDRSRWDRGRIDEGRSWLALADDHDLRSGGATAYLLQALIASEHAAAPTWAATRWPVIVRAYDELVAFTGSPVAALNRAVARSFASGPAAAIDELDRLRTEPALAGSHALALAQADVRHRLGDDQAAIVHYRDAVARSRTDPERRFAARRLAELTTPPARPDPRRPEPPGARAIT